MAAAAAAEAPRVAGSSAGDSYIGSLISLTSKCEIRYEGILYNINTQESSIGLRNVRSFGTEGRKKDGPQIPASEKVYEYILFRGSDIKDLQVKSSPPVQNAPIHNDPAIIQSHYSRPPPSSTSFPPVASGISPDFSSHAAHGGLSRPPFQGNLPLYQPVGSIGSWGSSPSQPPADGSGLAMPGPMPMYWQGYYAPTGTVPHLQQPSLMRPQPGLSIPQSMQQPLQYTGGTTYLPAGSQDLRESHSPLLPTLNSTLGSTSAPTVLPTLSPPQASSLDSEASSNQMPSKLTVNSIPTGSGGANLPFMPHLTSSFEASGSSSQNTVVNMSGGPSLPPISNVNHQAVFQPVSMFGSFSSSRVETSTASVPILPHADSHSESIASVSQNMPTSGSSNPRVVTASNVNYQAVPQSAPPSIGPSSSNQAERPPTLVTPDQLLQAVPSAIASSQPLQISRTDVEVKLLEDKAKPLLPEPPVLVPTETKEPILPLPMPTRQKPNGAVLYAHQLRRERGRGRGNTHSRPLAKFTEDFDFTAMNEKFNKDEVWGHLGKNKAQERDVDGDNIREDDESLSEDGDEPSKSDSKPTYVKDDFFDALSCDSLDRASQNRRPRFSEQLKIDTETFGEFSRHRPVRGGGRGFRGGGRTRGGYFGRGRGYGYGGRDRGRSSPYRPF